MSLHWDVMLQCYCCCCCYCYNVSNNSCSSAIFWPISAYNQPKSIPAGQTYCIFSLFLYSLLLLVNVTLLWCEYCNATVTISCCHYVQMLYVCVIVWDVAVSKYHQKMLLPLGTNAAAVYHRTQHAFSYVAKWFHHSSLITFLVIV